MKYANKKQNNFNICYIALKTKIKKKNPRDIIILHLCTKNLYDMIYNSWDKDRDRLKLVILGHFLPFYPRPSPLKSTKVKFWKIGKHCWIYHPKITISWDTEWDRTDVLSFWAYFCPFTSLIILKTKYLKKWKWKKNAWRFYPFTHVYYKWRSHDIWFLKFLKYKVQQTEFSYHFWLFFVCSTRLLPPPLHGDL